MSKNKLYLYPCKYCGNMCTGHICYGCSKKLKLVRTLLKMVRNKAKEVGYFDTHKK
jgi:hypothetical protein